MSILCIEHHLTDVLLFSDILTTVEKLGCSTTTPIDFPSGTGSFLVSLEELGCNQLIYDRVSTLETPAHAFTACVWIFRAITATIFESASTAPSSALPISLVFRNFNQLRDSVLDYMEDLDVGSDVNQFTEHVETLLQEIREVYDTCASKESIKVFAPQAIERYLECCIDLLSYSKLQQSVGLQKSLSHLLDDLSDTDHIFNDISATVQSDIAPILQQFLSANTSTLDFEFEQSAKQFLKKFSGAPAVNTEKAVTDQPQDDAMDLDRDDNPRPKKRRCTVSSENLYERRFKALAGSLILDLNPTNPNFQGFSERLELPTTGEDAVELITQLGLLSCMCAGTLSEPSPNDLSDSPLTCSICDGVPAFTKDFAVWTDSEHDEIRQAFLKILPTLSDFVEARITAAFTIKKILTHCMKEEHLILQSSSLGEFCLQLMRSSIREVRVAGTRVISSFMQKRLSPTLRRDNFMTALNYLQRMLDNQDIALKETAILALAQVAEVAGDKEMNIILLRLVEMLGHENSFLSDVAFSELFNLAEVLEMTPLELFRPFWRTVSILTVVNIDSRPQILSHLCELTAMSFEAFLSSAQEHIIPYLVSMRKYETIEMIDPDRRMSCFDICRKDGNLTSLLAFLLTQPSDDYDALVTSTFHDMAPNSETHTLSDWVSIQGIEITCELLRELGEATQETRGKYLAALTLVSSLKPIRKSSSSTEGGDVLALFIENHVLGIIRMFSQIVNEDRRSMVEKRRNILAIGEMVRMAPNHVNAALLQICACLRTALDLVELRDHAFMSWDVMIRSLEQEELESLLDQTYCIIIKYWDLFQEEDSRIRGRQLLEWLNSSRQDAIRSCSDLLPSLEAVPALSALQRHTSIENEATNERIVAVFIRRLGNEHAIVVEQALKELLRYLLRSGHQFSDTSSSQNITNLKIKLIRSLLDCCAKFNENGDMILGLSAQCLGILGAVDPNETEFVRQKKDILVLSNFDDFDETCDFLLFFIQNVLVGAYLSSDAESQGFLAWAMQNFLSICGFQNADFVPTSQIQGSNSYYKRWFNLPKFVRNLLTPLLSSTYTIEKAPAPRPVCTYPLFSPHTSHATWIRAFVLDMLQKSPKDGSKYSRVFEVSSKIIKKRDISIAAFLSPYAALNIFLNGDARARSEIISEMLNVLQYPLPDNSHEQRKNAILCSESVFNIMDYCSRWMQARRKGMANLVMKPTDGSEEIHRKRTQQLSLLEDSLSQIPAEVLSTRAVECRSFSRALFHWEKHIRKRREPHPDQHTPDLVPLFTRLQEIYAHIDEPDGAEGITADPHIFKIDQQVVEGRKGTRWLAAQNWFGMQIAQDPEDFKAQEGLLNCLKDRGQHVALLSQFDAFQSSEKTLPITLPMAVESAWISGDLKRLSRYLELAAEKHIDDFAIGLGSVLRSLAESETEAAITQIESLRHSVAKGLTVNTVSSFRTSHESVLKLHALSEVETVARSEKTNTFENLSRKLVLLGGCIYDKRYILNLRRATMQLRGFEDSSIASVWLEIARSARKANDIEEAFNAVTRAVKLHEPQAALEFAKLLWTEGNHRKAIQMLEETISSGALVSAHNATSIGTPVADRQKGAAIVSAKAHLLLARWLDNAGQTQSEVIARKYRHAISLHPRWEKAHYHLGKHYAKILESERLKSPDKQSSTYLSGEASKLVVENLLRSLAHGNKYVFQSLPKILTLWFESAAALDEIYDDRSGLSRDFFKHIMAQRLKTLHFINEQVKKYTDRIPTVLFLTILPQLVARICHPNKELNIVLRRIIMKTTFAYIQQALWTVLPLLKSQAIDRRKKGKLIFSEIQEAGRRPEISDKRLDITKVLREGQKLSDALVGLCGKDAKSRLSDKRSRASLSRDLLFDRSIARCSLVVPFETNIIPNLPLVHDAAYFAKFRAFPQGPVTFDDISDEVLILRSAQKPRKLNVRGSDGRIYGLLCKPEDLRKDERLMEFNRMINRFLKKDTDSTSRQLYIKTYAVTPLNEDSGLIEWVNNFRTLKDLIVKLLGDRGITLDWGQIQRDLADTTSESSKVEAFTNKVLRKYPPVFHEWFLEAFPEPGSWFAARLRYTRTCAVMSMVGHCLGLGDRHGENILFEEANGAVLHVDFNCLFDMGLTLHVPERVPFRLTHNMVDAFGVCGYNGPFRRTCEITLSVLRQSEDWLMPILETFVHDPTTEFQSPKHKVTMKVPTTAQGMLVSVQNKLRGLLPGESVPLSVGGQVDELIMQATSTKNLAHMYVGWAPWL